jgi:hypothetical protein
LASMDQEMGCMRHKEREEEEEEEEFWQCEAA